MAPTQPSPVSEELLSGYLDNALPQAEAQKIRILLEDDAQLRAVYEDLKLLRDAAASTKFVTPPDDAWPEWPQTPMSRFSRSVGWIVMIAWLIVVCGFALWRLLSSTGDPLEVFLVLGLPGAFVLLFVSVLIDRVRDLKTDRYRGIQR